MSEVHFMHNSHLGYFYTKMINNNKISIRISAGGDFGYYINDSIDIDDNKNIVTTNRMKILNFVKNILFYHLKTYKPDILYIHGADFNEKNRIRKDDFYQKFLQKLKLPSTYKVDREFTKYGDQSVIKKIL